MRPRRTWWRGALLAGALLVSGLAANAQVTNYTFSVGSDPYVALSSPTTFSINGGGGTLDDGYSSLQPIGFSFNFGGTSFTDFSVQSNGWLRLGATASTTDYSPMDNGTMNNQIAFNARDFNNTGAVYSYQLDGAPGSYICKIQAANFYRYNTTSHLGNAQVWLYEATGVIEIRYGSYATTWTSGTAQVGIRTTSSDVRKVVSGTWAAVTSGSTDGVGNTAGITQGTTNQVVSGTVFTFTPPVVCSGTPDPGSITTPQSACSGNTIVLTATGLSTGTNISYQWEESPDGSTMWAAVVGGSGATTASYTTTAITGTRYFRIVTTCSTGPNSNNSNVVTVNVNPGQFDEDFSSGTIIGNCWSQSGTGTAANLRYNAASAYGTGTGSIIWDFFTQNGLTLIYTSPVVSPIGSGMQIEFDVAGRQYDLTTIDSIYIEESNNGGASWTLVAAGSNEVGSIFNTLPINTSELNTPASGDWAARAFPLTAGTDRVRFRGVSAFGNNVLVDNIRMTAAPTCQAPTAVGVAPTLDGGTVSWTCTSCTGTFIVEYGAPGFTPGTDGTAGAGGTIWTGAPVAGSPIVLTGLTSATAYSVYVREVCPGPDYSPNSAVANFTTACASFPIPFSEDFSSVTTPALPNCWSTDDVNGPSAPTGFWRTATGAAGFTGPYAQYGYASAIDGDDWLMSPGLDLVGGTTYTVSYKYAAQSASFPEAMEVYYGSSNVAAGMTDLIVDHGTFSFTTPSSVSFNITPGSTGVYYIGWHAYSGADEFNINLDDISVVEAPPCPDPTAVSVTGTTFNGTNVNFTCSGCTGSVIVEFGVSPHTPGIDGTAGAGGTLVTGAVSPQAISLSPSTTYQIYVRQDCSLAMDGYSNNTAAVSVTTPAAPPANDLCSDAIMMSCNSTVTGSTATATHTGAPSVLCNNTGDPYEFNAGGRGVWYTVQGFDGTMTASLCGSSFDTQIWIGTTADCVTLTCVAGNDDDETSTCSNGTRSVAQWTGSSSETYYIYVTGWATASGNYELSVSCGDTNPSCTANGLNLEFQNDANPGEVTWEVLNAGNLVVLSGTNPIPANSIGTQAICLPNGCYRLRVLDSGGDGMTTGGYELRTQGGNERIIDNTNNFSSGSVSAISNNQTFCLPIGTDKLIYSSCDKLDWVNNKFIVASANPTVSGQFGVTNTTSGYEFWFFDPNGSYSYRRFRSHATSDGFGSGATRACHFKVNGWINSVSTPHLPNNVLLNVRVRGRVAGNNLEFGPACQFKLDAALAACPRVKLQDDPANTSDFSCGVSRNFGGASNPNNRIYAAPPQPIPAVASSAVRYQFRFRIPGENICIVRPPQTSARMVLNWTTGTPLECSKTYEVDVRVSLDGGATWCFGPAASSEAAACADTEAWGKVCLVTINPCALPNGGGNSMVVEGNNTFTMYPNPNRGDQLFLSVSNVEEGVNTVNVDIFDMTGKRVMARTIAVQDGFVNTNMELNGDLAGGLYVVNITAGTKAYTERLVIQP